MDLPSVKFVNSLFSDISQMENGLFTVRLQIDVAENPDVRTRLNHARQGRLAAGHQ
jgi:hypothetical protein